MSNSRIKHINPNYSVLVQLGNKQWINCHCHHPHHLSKLQAMLYKNNFYLSTVDIMEYVEPASRHSRFTIGHIFNRDDLCSAENVSAIVSFITTSTFIHRVKQGTNH